MPLAADCWPYQRHLSDLVEAHGAGLGLLARPLQQELDDLELLAARVAGVLLGSHPSIVRNN